MSTRNLHVIGNASGENTLTNMRSHWNCEEGSLFAVGVTTMRVMSARGGRCSTWMGFGLKNLLPNLFGMRSVIWTIRAAIRIQAHRRRATEHHSANSYSIISWLVTKHILMIGKRTPCNQAAHENLTSCFGLAGHMHVIHRYFQQSKERQFGFTSICGRWPSSHHIFFFRCGA